MNQYDKGNDPTPPSDAGDDLALVLGFGHIDVETQQDEWDAAWDNIKHEFGDFDCADPDFDEVWQYMGSNRDEDGWVHEFRHRRLKGADGYTYRAYPASEGWRPAPYRAPQLRVADMERFGKSFVDGECYYVLSADLSAQMERFVRDTHGEEALASPTTRWAHERLKEVTTDQYWNCRFVYEYIERNDPTLCKA